MVVEEEFECLKIKMRFFNGGIIFIMLMISVLVVALLINSVEARRPSRSVRNMSWHFLVALCGTMNRNVMLDKGRGLHNYKIIVISTLNLRIQKH